MAPLGRSSKQRYACRHQTYNPANREYGGECESNRKLLDFGESDVDIDTPRIAIREHGGYEYESGKAAADQQPAERNQFDILWRPSTLRYLREPGG